MLRWLLSLFARPFMLALVVSAPEGGLCVLDPDTGQLRSSVAATAVDVLAAGPSEVWAVEPGDETEGRLARYRLSAAGLALDRAFPFGAPDGRLLAADDAPVVVALADGATLSAFGPTGGVGSAWPTPASAIVARGHGGLAIATLDDATSPWRMHHAFVAGGAPIAGASTEIATPMGPCGGRAVTTGAGIVLVTILHGLVVASNADHALARAPASGASCVEDALALPDGRIAALVGPEPAVHFLGASGSHRVALPGGPLPHVPWLSHRLALDAARGRLWVATDHALARVDLLPAPAFVPRDAGCNASAVALVAW